MEKYYQKSQRILTTIQILMLNQSEMANTYNGRNNKLQIFNSSNYKVGQNLLVNRFKPLNNKIDYLWFNESFNSYKIKCKTIFLH